MNDSRDIEHRDANGTEGVHERQGHAVRRVLAGLGATLAVVVGLLVAFVLLLQTDWGSTRAADALTGLANPYERAALTIGDVDGSWIGGLELHDVNLVRLDPAGDAAQRRLVHVDSIELRYDLLDLFTGTLHVNEFGLYGLDVEARQEADSTWDLLAPFQGPQDTTQQQGFDVRIDEITVRDADLTARYYAPQSDSTLRIRDLNVQVDALRFGEDVHVDLQELAVRITPPGEDVPVRVDVQAQLAEGRLTVAHLRLDSPRSDVRAEGTLVLPTDTTTTVSDVDFTLRADPLAFKDLAPFVPSLDPQKSARLTVEVRGSGRRLRADVEASLSGGATLALEGVFTPDTLGPVAYQLEGRVRDFDPGFFRADLDTLAGRAGTSLVNANLQVDLEGASLDALDGTLAFELFDTRLAEYAIERTRLTARFRDGRARVDLQSGLRGAELAARGTFRPFAAVPTYDLTAEFRNLDVGRFTDGSQQSDLGGTLTLEGQGLNPQTVDLTATLALAPSTVNRFRLTDGRLEVRLNDGRMRFGTRLTSPQGRFAVAGAVENLSGSAPLNYRITRGRLDSLNVAALTGDTTRSAFTGTFDLRGQGTAPPELRLSNIDLHLADSYYGAYAIETADLEGRLRNGRLYAKGRVVLEDAGRIRLVATAQPFAEPLTFAITEGTFENLDVGALAQNPNQESDLTGTFRLEGRGVAPEDLQFDAQITLGPSRLNQQRIEEATVEAALESGTLDVTLRLETPEGETRLAGTAQPFSETPTYALREGVMRGLNLGALLGLPALQSDLNATITAQGGTLADAVPADTAQVSAAFLERGTLDVRLDLTRSTVNDAVIQEGLLDVQLAEGDANLDIVLDLAQGRAEVHAEGAFAGEIPRYSGRASLTDVGLGDLLGRDTLRSNLSLDARFEGEGLDPQTMTLTGRLTSDRATFDSVQVRRLALDFRLAEGLLRVDTLLLRSNVADATGGGRIALFDTAPVPSDFGFTATVGTLAPLRPLLDAQVLLIGAGQIDGRITGPPDLLRFQTEVHFEGLAYNDVHMAGADLRLAGTLGPDRALEQAEIDGSFNYFTLPALSVQNADVSAQYRDDAVRFVTGVTIDQSREARVAGVLDLRPSVQRLELERFDVRFGEDHWQLLQDATVTYGEEYRVSGLLLYSEDQQIAVDGVVDLDGRQSLVVTIENFQTSAVADLLGYDGLGGRLNGGLILSGPAEAPNLRGSINYDVVSYENPVGTLNLGVRYDSLRLALDAQLAHRDGSTLQVEGHLPVDLRLSMAADSTDPAANRIAEGAVDLTATAEAFDIGWIRPFLDPASISRIDGLLTARVHVGGTRAAPDLSGEAALIEGVLGLPALGQTYDHVQFNLELEENRVVLRRAAARAGDGALVAEGTINLRELTLGEYALDLRANNFRMLSTRAYGATMDADLVLSGTTELPVLRGDVEILNGYFYLGGVEGAADVEEVALDEEALRALERRFGIRLAEGEAAADAFFPSLAMDLDIQVQRDVWVRRRATPEIAIQLTGDVDLMKEHFEELQVFGGIEVVPERSNVEVYGRRFNITSGTVTFNGPVANPVLDVEARLPIRSRQDPGRSQLFITLRLSGRPDDLDLQLGANETLDTADIVSYIVTGRPASQALQFGGGGGGGPLAPAQQLALGQLASFLENVGSGWGLDVVEIEVNGLEGASFTAGKYVSPRLYLGIRQPLSRAGSVLRETDAPLTQITIEYELTRWLLARLVGSPVTIRANLLWRYAY